MIVEEFPAHHRQMKQERDIIFARNGNGNKPSEPRALQRFILFTSCLNLQCTSSQQLKQYFASEDFVVLLQSEVDTLQKDMMRTQVAVAAKCNSTPHVAAPAAVVHTRVESVTNTSFDQWWEWSSEFANNTNQLEFMSDNRSVANVSHHPSVMEHKSPNTMVDEKSCSSFQTFPFPSPSYIATSTGFEPNPTVNSLVTKQHDENYTKSFTFSRQRKKRKT